MTTDWEFEHSIVTSANRSIAWAFWSDVQNHAKMEGVRIELDGPFQTGSKGRTIATGFQQEWELSEVISEKRFVITGEDASCVLSFAWDFEDEGAGTRMTQRISAHGPQMQMKQWADELRQMEIDAPAGMARLAAELNRLGSSNQ